MSYEYSQRDFTVRLLAQASGSESRNDGSEDSPIPGDQIAHELDAVPFYPDKVNWGKVYRLDDPALREKVARFMEASICNGWIGYDTYHRNSHEKALAVVGYDPDRIAWACSTDCSMLTYEAVKKATGVNLNPYAAPYRPTGTYPRVSSFDYYMERILPLNGIKVTVFTVPNSMDSTIRPGATKYPTIVDSSNHENDQYLYESVYDDKTACLYDYNYGVEIGKDVSNRTLAEAARAAENRREYGAAGAAAITANLTVNVGSSYASYLTGEDNWIRGDIVRTRSPIPKTGATDDDHGHIAVWI